MPEPIKLNGVIQTTIKLLCVFFSALFVLSPTLHASVSVQSTLNGVTSAVEFKWYSNTEKVPEYSAVVSLNFPQSVSLTQTTSAAGSRILSRGPGTLKVLMTSISDTIQGIQADGATHSAQITVSPDGQQITQWNCKNLNIELVPFATVPKEAYIGIACKRAQNGEVTLWISIPKEAEWGSTSLFEDAGKGERWHQFTLQRYEKSISEKELGAFNFSLNGVAYGYKLIQRRDEAMIAEQNADKEKAQQLSLEKQKLSEQKQNLENENKNLKNKVKLLAAQKKKPEEPMVALRGGLGVAKLDLSVDSIAQSSMQPIFIFAAKTKSLFLGLHVGSKFKYAFPMGEKSQIFYDIGINLGPSFSLGENSKISPTFGFFTLGQDFDPEGISFRHTSTSVGIELTMASIWLEAELSGMLPSGESKFMGIGAGFRPSYHEPQSLSFGIYYQKTSYTLITSSYGQMMGLVFLHF